MEKETFGRTFASAGSPSNREPTSKPIENIHGTFSTTKELCNRIIYLVGRLAGSAKSAEKINTTDADGDLYQLFSAALDTDAAISEANAALDRLEALI